MAFVPREEVFCERSNRPDRVHYTRPIFATYVFFLGERDAAFKHASPSNVLNTTPDDCRDIDNLLKAYNAGPVRRSLFKGIDIGLKVKVVSGPARGVEGKVEKFGDTKIYLGVGRFGVAEIDVSQNQIEPLIGD